MKITLSTVKNLIVDASDQLQISCIKKTLKYEICTFFVDTYDHSQALLICTLPMAMPSGAPCKITSNLPSIFKTLVLFIPS